MTSQRPVPHSVSSRVEGIKAGKYGPKLITLVNSFYAYRRRKRTSSSPSWRIPSSLIKFSPEECTDCVMYLIIDTSRTHGTRPDSEDSTPSVELCVRLLTSAFCLSYILSLSFFIALKVSSTLLTHTAAALACSIYMGASYTEA